MKTSSIGLLAAGAAGLIGLAVFGVQHVHKAPAVAGGTSAASPAEGGFRLTSASIDLPVDDAQFPAGPNVELVSANCTGCHSASMALTQPALSAEQWKATVSKMREVYHAPVAERDVPAILAYLTTMPGQKAAPATGKAQDPNPKAPPIVTRRTS